MVSGPTPALAINFGLASNSNVDEKGTFLRESWLAHNGQELALLDSATTHTILRDFLYFSFTGSDADAWEVCQMQTIAGGRDFKFCEGQATIVLPGGATLLIANAMFAPSASRSLISFKDMQANDIHTTTIVKINKEALLLQRETEVLTTAYAGCGGLYEFPIRSGGQPHKVSLAKPQSSKRPVGPLPLPEKVGLWHSRMDHPGTTMFQRMIPILSGHEVCQGDANKTGMCTACAQGKMINQPSRWKLPTELSPQLHRLHGDICGPIAPPSGPFRYFMVLVDAAGIQFEVSLLSTRNIVFSKLLAMLIKFRTHYLNYPVKTLRMDNVGEFKSQHFEDYCMATGIEFTYSVPYEHSQNGLAEAFIKKIQLISRPLLIQANLPSYF